MAFMVVWAAFGCVALTAVLGTAISLLERHRVVPVTIVGGYYTSAALSLPLLLTAVVLLHPWTSDGARDLIRTASQTNEIERVVTALGLPGLSIERSDGRNNPIAVFQ